MSSRVRYSACCAQCMVDAVRYTAGRPLAIKNKNGALSANPPFHIPYLVRDHVTYMSLAHLTHCFPLNYHCAESKSDTTYRYRRSSYATFSSFNRRGASSHHHLWSGLRTSFPRPTKAEQGVCATHVTARLQGDDGRWNLKLPPTPPCATLFQGSLSTVTIRSARSCRGRAAEPTQTQGPQPICKNLFLSLFRQARGPGPHPFPQRMQRPSPNPSIEWQPTAPRSN